jgi:thiosulfate dehydrogenase
LTCAANSDTTVESLNEKVSKGTNCRDVLGQKRVKDKEEVKGMKKVLVLTLAVAMAFAVVAVFAQDEKAEKEKRDPEMEFKYAVKRGKALFSDPELGTNGMSCTSCHKDGGTVDGIMGEIKVKAFDKLNTHYPKYVSMMGQIDKVITLDQMVNFCIVNPMAGKALAADDQKLADLVAYCSWVKPVPIPNTKKEGK